MAKKIGITFPFMDSDIGDYFNMNLTTQDEVKSNLINLLTTRVGERFMSRKYGTRLMEKLFEPNDSITSDDIRRDLDESVQRFLPNVTITNLTITNFTNEESSQYKASVTCDFTYNSNVLSFVDRFVINI